MTQPTLTDDYWFAYSKDLVDSALKRRDEAANKLQTVLGWFWMTYTTAVATLATISHADFSAPLSIFISAPVILLLVAYWMCTQAQMPKLVRFDFRRPKAIRTAYEAALLHKSRWLAGAQVLAGLGATSVAIALFLANTHPKLPVPPPRGVDLSVYRTQKAAYLRTDAYLPNVKTVEMVLTPTKPSIPSIAWTIPLKNGAALVDNAVPQSVDEFTVAATYETDSERTTTEMRFKKPDR
jgi:hypothetical protein